MFHELLSKVTGQEQEWRKVVDRLSTEMECKVKNVQVSPHIPDIEVEVQHGTAADLTCPCPLTAAQQDGVGLCEEAAGGWMEELPPEASG